jgi:Immunoglobulin I-set domain
MQYILKFFYCACAEKELPGGFPQILQNPGMKVVEKGRNAVLVCEATGEPTPAIAWVRDTVPIDLEVFLTYTIFAEAVARWPIFHNGFKEALNTFFVMLWYNIKKFLVFAGIFCINWKFNEQIFKERVWQRCP